jgi:hypothetical protein
VLHAKVLGAVVAATLAVLGGSRPISSPPAAYYLALGESIAYGIQPGKMAANLPPSAFRTGYVDLFAGRLRKLAPKIRVVNYGCPGESARTFIAGGCPWLLDGRKLHDAFRGTQLHAALAFLRAHPGRVSPITLTLWGNDVNDLSQACGDKLACVRRYLPHALAVFSSRFGSILRQVRAAAPNAEIIVTGVYDGNVAGFAVTDPLYRELDSTLAARAAASQAYFADTFPIFNPQGDPAREKARICALTFICSTHGATGIRPTPATGRSPPRSGLRPATDPPLPGPRRVPAVAAAPRAPAGRRSRRSRRSR